MKDARHYFALEARFGPADLFRLLKKACDRGKFVEHKPEFDFDWLKRKVTISANTAAGARTVTESFVHSVEAQIGAGQLLVGKPIKENGRTTIPIGVLVQTPDIYVEIMVQSLQENGIKKARIEDDGEGFSLPAVFGADVLDCDALIGDFPLPSYIRIVDKGIS